MIDIFATLGTTMEGYILIVTTLGSFVFFAADLRLGVMLLFSLYAIEFMGFYAYGLDTTMVLYAFLGMFAVLSATLIITARKNSRSDIV